MHFQDPYNTYISIIMATGFNGFTVTLDCNNIIDTFCFIELH